MKRLSYILAAAIVFICNSCIKNDIPYPVEQVNIIGMEGVGFTVTFDDIDFKRRTVTLHLDETTDISKVNVRKTEISPDNATSSRPLTGTFDLRTPVYVTLTLYQDYEWTIKADQTIERRFTVEGQVGASEIDADNCIAKVNVSEDVDLKHIVVTDLKLGPEGVTTMTPTAAELTDFETVRYVDVSYFDVKERWQLSVTKLHYDVLVTESNLWKNTATVAIRLDQAASSVSFEYKRSTENEWQTATVASASEDGVSYTASIQPTWKQDVNEAGLQIYIVDAATGVFAGQTYDYKLIADGQTIKTSQFSIDGGDVIPDGDMKSSILPCFTKTGSEKTEFWGSGNNAFTAGLCTQSLSFGGVAASAKLAAAQPLGMPLLAAGNLFTGTFKYKGSDGTVSFGQKYTYTARPTAVKVKYHAKIGTVNFNKYGGKIDIGKPDKSRIFVCIIDWSERHDVRSGLSQPYGMWDPETTNSVQGSGDIIGYGSLFINESSASDQLEEVVLPISYYKMTDSAPDGRYTIVISCSTSAYGDYINGCTTNVMYVTDFEWVY